MKEIKDESMSSTPGASNASKMLNMSKGDAEGDDIDTSCGYFCCKPFCSKTCCNTPKGLGTAVSFYAFEYGIIQLGVVSIIVVPLQRRYQFTATQAAWIPASQDFFAAILAIMVGYLGTFVHKGRLLTISAIAQFVGCSLFVLVHLISPKYEAGAAEQKLCDPDSEPDCYGEIGSNELYYAMFIMGQLCQGISGGILYCVAVPYMDENMKAKNTPLYIGIMYALSAAGAMTGYILGGLMLTIYVDLSVDLEELDITPADPRWVGAWWIPYGIGMITSAIAALYLGAYPRYLPVAMKYQAERKTEAYGGGDGGQVLATSGALSKLFTSTKIILSNPTFLLLALAGIFESGLMNGFIVFFPAIVVFQFDQNPAEAAVIAGIVVVPAAIGGQVLGGYIPRRFGFKVRGLIIQTGVCALVVALLAPALLLSCPISKIAGVSVDYGNTEKELKEVNLTAACNAPCSCDTRVYDPICGTNDVQYFTPCHAACLDSNERDERQVFKDCGCIPPSNETFDATSGSCDSDCNLFPIFLGGFFFAVLALFIGVTSGVAAVVRCVPETERSYGTGLQSTIIRFLGNVPFPVMMGVIFDQSCLVWQYRCEERGSCWMYDTSNLAFGLAIITFVSKAVAVVCHVLATLLYKPPPNEDLIKETLVIPNDSQDTIVKNGRPINYIAVVDSDKGMQSTDTRKAGYHCGFSTESDITKF